ncbi:MAG: NAD(P)(+) transhydrogenase (Re/Si-specific) subunit beta [Pirellulaceae bacterium]|nr:NAD(P)(+) transhydrogenase (Re/Si-specific) subunit beta [Planctomycetales bacterium]
MTIETIIKLSYLVSAILFIFGLKKMSHPRTAVQGNWLGAAGMFVALAVTLFDRSSIHGYGFIVLGLVAGSAIGAYFAKTVEMTAMPQMVALFNGFGGGASILVAGAELGKLLVHQGPDSARSDVLIATAASGLIGAVTFWGSLVAYGKLQELKVFRKPLSLPGHQIVNGGLAVLLALLTFWLVQSGGSVSAYVLICIVSSVLGVLLVVPIGGADMPVVIALLNSYSGLAAAATGFVIDNSVLIIAGSLVGASGVILTQIMCKAMNRSLTNVLFGVMEGGGSTADADEVYANVRSTSAEDVAMILETAQRVVVVPGYGMAVAQAQHAVRDLANILEKRGTNVEFAIHPVAGRMPGHMNVLLAEADIPYEKLLEMDQINPTMETVDVAIVIGANDVVNPVARTDPNSPIAGMPIIDVDKARTVIVIKRSLSPGFAQIPNPLFAADNALMLFGDGKQAVLEIVTALKENM